MGENSCPPGFVPTRTVWRCNASTRRQRRNPEARRRNWRIRRLFARVVLKQFIEKRAAALSTVAPLAAARVGDDEVELDEVGEKDSNVADAKLDAKRCSSYNPENARLPLRPRPRPPSPRRRLLCLRLSVSSPPSVAISPPRSSVVSRTPRRRPSIPKSPPAVLAILLRVLQLRVRDVQRRRK